MATNKQRRKSSSKHGKVKKPATKSKLDGLVESLADKYVKPLSTDKQGRLEEELKSTLEIENSADLDSTHLWNAMDSSDHRMVIERGNKKYLRAFAIAWKVHEYISSSKDRLVEEIPKLAKRAGMKITANFDPLVATFRATIKYDDRRLWSRDAQAVRWLRRQNQTPDTVFQYQKEHHGGVHVWAGKEQKYRREQKLKAGGAAKPQTKTAVMRIAALRKELQDGEGAVLMVKKKGTALISLGFKIIPNANKHRHWPKIKDALTGTKSTKP